jgi:hypothetical protein
MAPSPLPATPGRELSLNTDVSHHIDVVWGAPSDEMLDAEARGDIILVEDIQRSSAPHDGASQCLGD